MMLERTTDHLLFEYSDKEILKMNPIELVDFLTYLEQNQQLEVFLERAVKNRELLSQLSYWEKWLNKDQADLLERIILEKRKLYGETEHLPLELEKQFDEEELKIILSNLGAIQLTFGCSKACPFCGFDATKGVREHIPYSALVNMFSKYKDEISKALDNNLFMYWASEVSDYESEGKTYEDIHELVKSYFGKDAHVTTSNIEDEDWISFVETIKNKRFSLFGKTDVKASKISWKFGQQSTIGRNSTHKKGIGKSMIDDTSLHGQHGIGCFNGTLITPRGLYNIFQVPISESAPQGQLVIPFKEFVSDEDVEEIIERKSVLELLQHTIVCHNGGITTSKNNRFLKVESKNKIYFVAFDKDFQITSVKIIQSKNPQDANRIIDYRYRFGIVPDFQELARSHTIKNEIPLTLDRFDYFEFILKQDKDGHFFVEALLPEDKFDRKIAQSRLITRPDMLKKGKSIVFGPLEKAPEHLKKGKRFNYDNLIGKIESYGLAKLIDSKDLI